eukprot:TRINITY_DN2972_c1_g1_i2.p1 TRINITY_DN2972_c1_g1~~TRINITY_DN2972_c1_g1_i2.p1  ORF type:complete len:453 (+),score=167.70 TRINITY_DN2972_c1_g1_i2:143-1501(+)
MGCCGSSDSDADGEDEKASPGGARKQPPSALEETLMGKQGSAKQMEMEIVGNRPSAGRSNSKRARPTPAAAPAAPSPRAADMEKALRQHLEQHGLQRTIAPLVANGICTLESFIDASSPDDFPEAIPLATRKQLYKQAQHLAQEAAPKDGSADRRWRPLHHAAWQGRTADLQRLLRDAGTADIDAQGPDGKTPLHLAAGHGHEDCVEELLHAGATVTIRDYKDRVPADFAEQYGHPEIAVTIRFYGQRAGPRDHADRLFQLEGLQRVESQDGSFDDDYSDMPLHVIKLRLEAVKREQDVLRRKMDPEARPKLLELRKQVKELEEALEVKRKEEEAAGAKPAVTVPGVGQVDSEDSGDESPKRPPGAETGESAHARKELEEIGDTILSQGWIDTEEDEPKAKPKQRKPRASVKSNATTESDPVKAKGGDGAGHNYRKRRPPPIALKASATKQS